MKTRWNIQPGKDMCLNSTRSFPQGLGPQTSRHPRRRFPWPKQPKPKQPGTSRSKMVKAGVVRQPKQDKIIVHFSSREHVQMYKGRVVFLEVDNVKDDDDYKAFAEQCASASQMQAANFLDTISRFLGLEREANDAVSAYSPLRTSEAPRKRRLPKKECQQIWILGNEQTSQLLHITNMLLKVSQLEQYNCCSHMFKNFSVDVWKYFALHVIWYGIFRLHMQSVSSHVS